MKFRFPEEARAKYGAEWHEIDFTNLEQDVDCGVLERFEDETGFMVLRELPELLARGSYRALRAAMWLALLVEGHRIKWAVFKGDPRTDPRLIEVEEDVADEEPEGEQSSPPPNRAAPRTVTDAEQSPSGT